MTYYQVELFELEERIFKGFKRKTNKFSNSCILYIDNTESTYLQQWTKTYLLDETKYEIEILILSAISS